MIAIVEEEHQNRSSEDLHWVQTVLLIRWDDLVRCGWLLYSD